MQRLTHSTVLSGACVLVMVAVFALQETRTQWQESGQFSVHFRNIAYGYHSASNLCYFHTPNGSVQGSEQCDDGNAVNTDACLSTCKTATCGDGYVRSGSEGCDDANTTNGDGCSSTCTVESGWSCTGTAPSSCVEVCGNGIKTTGEGCDDSDTDSGDGCSSSCAVESGYTCTGTPSSCSTSCGDGIAAGAEACDDGNAVNTDACLNTCVSASCGDGYVRSGIEDCEPPGVSTCSSSCTQQTGLGGGNASFTDDTPARTVVRRAGPPPHCGNGVLEPEKNETCDDGRFNGVSTTCDRWCNKAFCGDGVVHPNVEECEPDRDEDGNFVVRACGGKSCSLPICDEEGMCIDGCRWIFLPLCLNPSMLKPLARPDASEEPAATHAAASSQPSLIGILLSRSSASSSGASASSGLPMQLSKKAVCGDAVVDPGEECDDGSYNSDTVIAACRNDCRIAHCGDRVTDPGEQCDDGNDILGDGCTPTCVTATCGNGALEVGEECDDGKRNSDTLPDSCSTLCLLPRCGDAITDPSFGESCDQGEGNSNALPDRCRLNCVPSRCGDGVRDGAEVCDDGNLSNADECNVHCLLPTCGNAIVESTEQCDDGNRQSGDGCSMICFKEDNLIRILLQMILERFWHV